MSRKLASGRAAFRYAADIQNQDATIFLYQQSANFDKKQLVHSLMRIKMEVVGLGDLLLLVCFGTVLRF